MRARPARTREKSKVNCMPGRDYSRRMRTGHRLLVLLPLLVFSATALAQKPDGGLNGWTRDEMRRESPIPHIQVVPATVVKLAVRTNGWWMVTLDNGQVWSQVENRPTAMVAVGDD